MKKITVVFIIFILLSCEQNESTTNNVSSINSDSLALIDMITQREKAMINRDIKTAIAHFSEQSTWINSQGYYFEGKEEILKFHNMLAQNDSLDYYYKAGTPKIRMIDSDNAVVYYSWKMFWYQKDNPKDTVNREIGLMTLTARKEENKWKWIAVTNQHSPWYYDKIEPVTID